MMSDRKSGTLILGFFAFMVALGFLLPSFPQDQKYHAFALDHAHAGIPHFWNVVSNAAFVIVALAGWFDKNRLRTPSAEIFRMGIFLTGFGSAYYHWAPTNQTLFWDRLPMTIAFSGVVAALVERRVNETWGRRILWPLVVMSAGTVVYWRATDQQGQGNLIPYGLVQFGTIFIMLLILWFFPKKGRGQRLLWGTLVAYVAAKLLEAFDPHIGGALKVMGGHPIKHVAAALGCWFILRALFHVEESGLDRAARIG